MIQTLERSALLHAEEYLCTARSLCKEALEALAQRDFLRAVAGAWSAVLHATAALAAAVNGRPCSLGEILYEPIGSFLAKVGSTQAKRLEALFRSIRDMNYDVFCSGWLDGEQEHAVNKAVEYVEYVVELFESFKKRWAPLRAASLSPPSAPRGVG